MCVDFDLSQEKSHKYKKIFPFYSGERRVFERYSNVRNISELLKIFTRSFESNNCFRDAISDILG